MSRLWLVEGLPGSGKSTAAERLCEQAISAGLPARWWLEEDKDHPVLPSVLRKRSAEPNFPDLCVHAFAEFIRLEDGTLILEGAAFQSTLRFMFANGVDHTRMSDYVDRWANAIAPADPRLLLFRVEDPRSHYGDFVAERRGSAWMKTLIAYVERTSVAQAQGWIGLSGFVSFWQVYQDLCASIAATLPLPILVVPAWSESRSFDQRAAMAFFTADVA